MDWRNSIHSDPEILVGKSVVRGTRLSVEFLLDLMANGWTTQQILDSYPTLTPDALSAVFAYVAELFRVGKIGSAVVAEMLGLPDRWAAIEFLSERGVYPGYEREDLEADRQTLQRLGILEQ